MTDYTVAQLEEMIKDLTLADFEKTDLGDIYRRGVKFHMRVGLYMGRPYQVIMACGKFVQMYPYSASPLFKGFTKLNPEEPDDALYDNINSFRWKPELYSNIGEIVNTTLRNRSVELAANLSRNNAALARLTRHK